MLLESFVDVDDAVRLVASKFDYQFDGRSTFEVPDFSPPSNFSLGLIVGPSGSGKSSLLRKFGETKSIQWNESKAIISQFENTDAAFELLSAVGLNSLPSWVRPYHVLSTGEKFRANLARQLCSGAVIDEFTSVVDRVVARSTSVAVRRYIDKNKLHNVVFATCHYDIVEWLCPDWIYDTATGNIQMRRLQRRPSIAIDIIPCDGKTEWPRFSKHHYLDASLNHSARCFIALWGNTKVGFASALAFPNGNFNNAWRGHRTVILPDYQGIGLGPRLSDAIAQIFIDNGCRYFSKTAHPRLGAYRDASSLWRPTSKNHKARKDYAVSRVTKEQGHKMKHIGRICFSHEYIGNGKQ